MIDEDKVIVIDIDGTLCHEKTSAMAYEDAVPNKAVVEKLKAYRQKGFYIIIDTSRNMRTYQGNIGKINADTLITIANWLKLNGIPHDEIHVGKPWAGHKGFYVDDRTIRPEEFVSFSYEQIMKITGRQK